MFMDYLGGSIGLLVIVFFAGFIAANIFPKVKEAIFAFINKIINKEGK